MMALPRRDHFLKVALVVMSMVAPAFGTSSGALPKACNNLTPMHGGTAQTSASPYTVTFTPSTFTPGGSPVTVTLSKTSGSPVFKGFLLTTQYDQGDPSVRPGVFGDLPANTKLICTNNKAVTHSSPNTQNSLSFKWTPPATRGGNVRFRATFVQSLNTYWVDVRPATLLMEYSANTSQSNTSQSVPSQPAPTTSPAPAGQVQMDPACGSSKGCYSDCQGSSCTYLLSWAPGRSADTVQISMSGVVSADTGRYIALGLSEDNKMGGDSVVYCINAPNGAFLSYNVNEGSNDNVQIDQPQAGLSDIRVSFQDGVLTCSFMRAKSADINNKRFALTKPYTLFYAMGPGTDTKAGYHGKTPLISTQAASLVDFSVNIGGSSNFPLIKAHGSLMIVAWIFAASIGIVLARYFKDVWQKNTWCGEKVWFQIHRTCMVTALLATVAAFIIIFVEVGGYSEISGEGYKKAHPILGIIVTALTIINPVMAMFRPHPGESRRPIFNWAHWMVGTGAHILGVITIFFGVLLGKADAPKYIIYILAAYVGWQVLIQMLLELVQCMGRTSDHSEAYEMTDINNGEPNKPNSQKETSFSKRLLIFLHMLVVTGFAVALIIVLNIGNNDD
ncbi:hypothetical protein ACOMHN_006798 [Nucella lapillus]